MYDDKTATSDSDVNVFKGGPVITDAQKFNDELQGLLNKYPNIRLTVTQQITINELAKAPEAVAVPPTEPVVSSEKA